MPVLQNSLIDFVLAGYALNHGIRTMLMRSLLVSEMSPVRARPGALTPLSCANVGEPSREAIRTMLRDHSLIYFAPIPPVSVPGAR